MSWQLLVQHHPRSRRFQIIWKARYTQCSFGRNRKPNYAQHHQRFFHILKVFAKIYYLYYWTRQKCCARRASENVQVDSRRVVEQFHSFYYLLFIQLYLNAYKKTLFASAPLLKKKRPKRTTAPRLYLQVAFSVWKKHSHLLLLLSDSCSVNQLFATLSKFLFIACERHKLNLAKEKYFNSPSGRVSTLKSLQELLWKTRTLNSSTRLGKLLNL